MSFGDEQRLKVVRAKLRRLGGNKELSPRQQKSLHALTQEAERLTLLKSLDTAAAAMLDELFKK